MCTFRPGLRVSPLCRSFFLHFTPLRIFLVLSIDTGLNISVFGGLVMFQFSTIMLNNFASMTAVAGQIFYQQGGVLIMTAMEIIFNSLMEKFSGFGGLTLGSGS